MLLLSHLSCLHPVDIRCAVVLPFVAREGDVADQHTAPHTLSSALLNGATPPDPNDWIEDGIQVHLVPTNLFVAPQVTNIASFMQMQCCLVLSCGATTSQLTQNTWFGWKLQFDVTSGMAIHTVKFKII